MAPRQEPLDEIQWFAPQLVAHYGGIHENTVLYYFADSSFFDKTSNNHQLFVQALNQPALAHVLSTRDTFEAELDKLAGLEYRVVLGPKDFGPELPIGQGKWIIRKQERIKRAGAPDTVKVLATYMVIGEIIYQSPSVLNIVWARMLSATAAMKNFLTTLKPLSIYTPALGHRYFDPTLKSAAPPATSASSVQSRVGSPLGPQRPASPAGSVDTSTEVAKVQDDISDIAGPQVLYESFSQFVRYGHEFMDENPLTGEPGAFVFSSTRPNLQARKEALSRAQPNPINKIKEQDSSRVTTPQQAAATPLAKPADLPPKRKGSQGPEGRTKFKRRKSKAPTSPSSPLSVGSPATPAG